MEPSTDGQTTEPLHQDVEGNSVFLGEEFDAVWLREAAIESVESMTDAELLAEAGVETIVSTGEAAEYFDRTPQWVYWGLKTDHATGPIFVWSDGTPIVPERSPQGRRRFTTTILRAILMSCYRRGNITDTELKTIIRRIKYTELGVEWREREGWRYVYFGRNHYRWVHPSRAYKDKTNNIWKLRKEAK